MYYIEKLLYEQNTEYKFPQNYTILVNKSTYDEHPDGWKPHVSIKFSTNGRTYMHDLPSWWEFR